MSIYSLDIDHIDSSEFFLIISLQDDDAIRMQWITESEKEWEEFSGEKGRKGQ